LPTRNLPRGIQCRSRPSLPRNERPTLRIRQAVELKVEVKLRPVQDVTVLEDDVVHSPHRRTRKPRTLLTIQGVDNYCDDLVLGGADDWRLPTVVELLSTVDYNKSNPAADAAVFVVPMGGTPWYWTRTAYQPSPSSYAWDVGFSNGSGSHDFTNDYRVRCVR